MDHEDDAKKNARRHTGRQSQAHVYGRAISRGDVLALRLRVATVLKLRVTVV